MNTHETKNGEKSMEQNSHPDAAACKIILGQIRECFGRVVYSHKTHEKCADILLERQSWLKNTQIAISVILSGALIKTLLADHPVCSIISAILSTVLAGINLYFKNYNYGQLAQSHKESADRLWNIRESYISLLTDLTAGVINAKQASERRDKLQKELAIIYSRAPRTNSKAYRLAQQSLQYSEDMTFSSKEIDAFLPDVLKTSKSDEPHSHDTTNG